MAMKRQVTDSVVSIERGSDRVSLPIFSFQIRDRSNEFWEVPGDFLRLLQELSRHRARRVLQRS